MSTIKCPDCGRKISSRTAFDCCPYCGCPTSTIIATERGRSIWRAIVIIVIAVFVLIGYLTDDSKKENTKQIKKSSIEVVGGNKSTRSSSSNNVSTAKKHKQSSSSSVDETVESPTVSDEVVTDNVSPSEDKIHSVEDIRKNSMEVSIDNLDEAIKEL